MRCELAAATSESWSQASIVLNCAAYGKDLHDTVGHQLTLSCLLALLVACHWALGSVEAVLACITPALITPPAALVVRAYVHSDAMSREERATHAFERAAAPVISSCVAVAFSMAPMLGCQQEKPFKVAAALIFVSITNILWACLFLPALLASCR